MPARTLSKDDHLAMLLGRLTNGLG